MKGFGLTDGEATERLWSFLRPLAKITKEMTNEHRVALLNDALFHYCRRKTAGLGNKAVYIVSYNDLLALLIY